jgi:hypothetical protein
MGHWQKGDKDRARSWFDKAADSLKQRPLKNRDLRLLWAEAAELTGRPGPPAAAPTPPATPAGKKPH